MVETVISTRAVSSELRQPHRVAAAQSARSNRNIDAQLDSQRAAIYVNDRLTQQALLHNSTCSGKYNVRVEKDGIRKSESVEIRNGVTSYLRIPLQ